MGRLLLKAGKRRGNSKMKLEVTEQDKRLLSVLLALLVAAACIFLGIKPLHKANMEMEAKLESVKSEVEEKQRKIAGLAQIKSVNEELHQKLQTARESFYPKMESQEIDRILTGMAMECGLSIKRMEIRMPAETFRLPAYYPEGEAGLAEDTEEQASILQVQVLLEVTGSREGKTGLIDTITEKTKGMRILTMRRIKMKSRSEAEENWKEQEILELLLEVSMCREE
jgi:Tfp pilus assembly protein PilO